MRRLLNITVWQEPREHDPLRDGDFERWASGSRSDCCGPAATRGQAIARGVAMVRRTEGLAGSFHATATRRRVRDEERRSRRVYPRTGSVRWRRAMAALDAGRPGGAS